MFKIANEPPADILSIKPDVPPGLVAFLQRAMEKNPEARFGSGQEFATALRAAFAGGGAAPVATAPAATAPAAAAPAAKADGVDIEL